MDEPAKEKNTETLRTPTTNKVIKEQDNRASLEMVLSNFLANLNIKPNTKFTLTKARTVDNHTLTDQELTSPDQIPDYILQTLMTANYHAREFELKTLTACNNINEANHDFDSDESDDEGKTKDSNSDTSEDGDIVGVNPMDGLLGIFHCSDIFLRRALAIKLSACQLSVPFLLPDPKTPSTNATILLSALEGITKSWKGASNDNESTREVFATEYPFPVVSFMRIGKTTKSKSSLLNKIMSDANGDHDFFFHKNIQGGDVTRKLVDGLVELSWYLPGRSEKQTLKNEICFANLRGDAMIFTKQVDVLLKISSVLCILLPSNCGDKTITTMLEKVMQFNAKVILIFNEKRQAGTKEYFNDLKSKHRGKFSCIKRANMSNKYRFLQAIRESIQRNIQEVKSTPLVEFASCASQYGIQLDDNQSHLRLETRVDSWLKLGIKEAKNLLKLQMHIPMLADLEREKYGAKRRTNRYKSSKSDHVKRDINEIYKDIKAEKEDQKESFYQLDERVLHYLNCIAVMNKTERSHALNKMKHQLDKLSLQIMAKLHQKYRVASLSLQKKEKETCLTSDTPLSEEKHLKKLEESISKCSFGLEHIIRELAQLYQLPDISTNDYAGVAAEMLLSGQPLELLDGDSSYIPLRWFNAVYRKLEEKTKDRKIFVISVLGIQSSGKSTMLNTMFGLEFPVSAGRCTRGAFASLIPVSDSLNSASNFDFVLIIDTEGLKGSADSQRERDNELATFAIGVADVTIVNIFGENHNEMKEFLEIAVHAFLKMKLVKEKKTCKIVHQNVAATDAIDKLTFDRFHLKQDLDKMAKLAAIQENCEDKFQKLNDIISFDENEDVFYIPSLLKGSPPMAPVNPYYGRAVQKLKHNIITLMCSKGVVQLSVSQFRERVSNLWKAMLKENFIFSFRNTIEVRAYTSLDRKYFEESVKLMVIGMAELEREVKVTLSRCKTRKEREEKWKESRKQIRDEAEKLERKMKIAMKHFFETSEDKSTLEQWIETVMNRIVQLKENQQMTVINNCLATFYYWQSRQDVEEKKLIYKKELLQNARKFITSAQNTDDAEKCKKAFEQEWHRWMVDVPQCQESKIDVNSEMMDVLCHTNGVLNAEMSEKLRVQNYCISKFGENAQVIEISQLSIGYVGKIRNYVFQQQKQVLSSAEAIQDQALAEALKFSKMALKSGGRCTRNDLTQMYHKVITTIDEETEKCHFKFHNSLKCDILLYTFAKAYKTFDEMEERYVQERDIKSDLERNLRPKLESYFLNLCSEMEKEVLAANSVFDVIQNPMELELNKAMGPAVTGELLKNARYQSKGPFHASVLIQLGEEDKFESYISYFKNPVNFLKEKLMESIESYCLEEETASVAVLLEHGAKKIKDNVFAAISTASKMTKMGNEQLTFWIHQFVENCATLAITKEMFAVAAINEDLKDVDVFETKLCVSVEQFLESLVKRGVDRATFRKWDPSPCDHLFTSMFGCRSVCPFCKCLCDQTVLNHAGNHSSRIHRPDGLVGYKDTNTDVLSVDVCTNNVAGKGRFSNMDTHGEWHLYEDYQLVNDEYGSWSISPDRSFEASTYWRWFMATYVKELAQHYKTKEPSIPLAWKDLTFREVKNQLRQEYNM